MVDGGEREFRGRVIARVIGSCMEDIAEFELLNEEQIRESQILEMLERHVVKYSQVLEARGVEGFTAAEQTEMRTRLCRRAVDVDHKAVVLSDERERAEPWIKLRRPEWIAWTNYRTQLEAEGKSLKVIAEHEEVIDRALDLAGDPMSGPRPLRKGLIMGNVQSGKTMNFIGLINKALDSGYHSIIILGGHMNELRRQAQERIDEGVIELDDADNSSKVSSVRPSAFTDTKNDLTKNTVRGRANLAASPGIYVIKKNVSILKTLIEEIEKSIDKSITSLPMLLIDDEADYASINTKYSDKTYTSTNWEIKRLLRLFSTATYVAYTATPFANVFIPFKDTVSGEFDDDLFPSDFIIRMPTPANYRGQDFYFPAVGELGVGPCREIDLKEMDQWLPVKHKKDHEIVGLTPQLREAVFSFLIAIAIRHLRGQENTHNTMLVNVSRFNDVQRDVAAELLDLKKNILSEIRAYGGLPAAEAIAQSPVLAEIGRLFQKEFDTSGFSFSDVLNVFHSHVLEHGVEVELVNGLAKPESKEKGSLSYGSNKEHGLWVIAVGGLKLSRGLTLEGLTTSFFSRNALAYDTLTQMCRWFGYRDGYEDTCRLYLLRESYSHYCYVADSIRQLDKELVTMRLANATPAEFGLKVKSSDAALLITAKNKLGSAKEIDFKYRLWGDVIHGARAKEDADTSSRNLRILMDQVSEWVGSSRDHRPYRESHIFEGVSYESLIDLLRKLDIPRAGRHKNINPLLSALSAMSQKGVELPTTILFSRQSASTHRNIDQTFKKNGEPVEPEFKIPLGFDAPPVNGITRSMSLKNGELFSPNVLIGDSNDLSLLFGGDLQDNSEARARYLEAPVLVIYLYRAIVKDGDGETKRYRIANEESPVNVAYSLHFPSQKKLKVEVPEMDTDQKYYVNEVFQEELELEETYDEDEVASA